jgi:hypothetical protein
LKIGTSPRTFVSTGVESCSDVEDACFTALPQFGQNAASGSSSRRQYSQNGIGLGLAIAHLNLAGVDPRLLQRLAWIIFLAIMAVVIHQLSCISADDVPFNVAAQ